MDGTRFDALTRALPSSRRGIVSALLAGVVLAGRVPEALACKNFGKKCDQDNDCCAGMKCQNDECKCENGFSRCTTRCYDLDTDVAHCGACDTVCAAAESCCTGTCSNPNTDHENCGACGAACTDTEICLAGTCAPCPRGNQICGNVCCLSSQTCCDGTCVDDLASNENHCGACGNQCPRICLEEQGDPPICNGPRCCSGGVCLKSKSLQSNPDNCGACGHACAAGESCCDGECVDFDSDSDHCGACGDACPSALSCCGGRCVNLDGDVANCSECGNDCTQGGGIPNILCCAGVCCGGRTIGDPQCCEDQCVDIDFDGLNCGSCGLVCASLVCCDGHCCPPLASCDLVARVCFFDEQSFP